MTTPPFAATSLKTASDTLRGWSSSARALECAKITGAFEAAERRRVVPSLTRLEVDEHPEPVELM